MLVLESTRLARLGCLRLTGESFGAKNGECHLEVIDMLSTTRRASWRFRT